MTHDLRRRLPASLATTDNSKNRYDFAYQMTTSRDFPYQATMIASVLHRFVEHAGSQRACGRITRGFRSGCPRCGRPAQPPCAHPSQAGHDLKDRGSPGTAGCAHRSPISAGRRRRGPAAVTTPAPEHVKAGQAGIRRQTCQQPSSASASAVSVPPASAARSRRPVNPYPSPVPVSGLAVPDAGSGLLTSRVIAPAG